MNNKKKRYKSPVTWKESMKGYFFIAPWAVGFLVLTLWPFLFALYSSFTAYDIVNPHIWIGFKNYLFMFTGDQDFRKALSNTIYYVVFSVPLVIILALMLASLLNTKVRGVGIFRTIFYLPSVVSGVALSMLWMWMFNPTNGLINVALGYIGIKGPAWFSDPAWAKPALVVMRLWPIGGSIILFLAALQDVPKTVYEAAEIDGATGLKRYFNVTLPLITPTILYVLITVLSGAFQTFETAFIISRGTGSPSKSTLFYNLHLYNMAFAQRRMGYACALGIFLFLIIVTISVIQMQLSNRWVYYEGEESR